MMVPVLGCEKIEPVSRFYTETLGCTMLSSYSLGEGQLDPCHRSFDFRGDMFHLTSFPGDQGTGKSAYVYLDDPAEVDALYELVKDHPLIKMPVPLTDQTWGMREFNFIDPGGNRISIGARLSNA